MNRLKNIAKTIITVFFIALIAFVNINRGLYLHSHKTADGRTVVHAHPYAKSDANGNTPSHHHTSKEERFLDSQNFEWINSLGYFEIVRTDNFETLIIPTNATCIPQQVRIICSLRAPPSA